MDRKKAKAILVEEFMRKDSMELADILIDTLRHTRAVEVTDDLITEARWQIDQEKRGFCEWAAEGALDALGF